MRNRNPHSTMVEKKRTGGRARTYAKYNPLINAEEQTQEDPRDPTEK